MPRFPHLLRYLAPACGLALGCWPMAAPAQTPVAAPAATAICPDIHEPLDPEFNRWLTDLVRQHLPHEYVRDKDWGGQDTRWDGIRWEQQHGRWRMRSRKKSVNDGTWRKYAVGLRQPQQGFAIELRNCQELPGGEAAMEFRITADLNLEGRESKWVKGVQLYSFSATGHAQVALDLALKMSFSPVAGQFPPGLQVRPEVTSADLELLEFRIDRVSKAGGELTQQLSKLLSRQLREEIQEREEDLVRKLNEKLNQDPQRWQVALPWGRPATVPAPAQNPETIDEPR